MQRSMLICLWTGLALALSMCAKDDEPKRSDSDDVKVGVEAGVERRDASAARSRADAEAPRTDVDSGARSSLDGARLRDARQDVMETSVPSSPEGGSSVPEEGSLASAFTLTSPVVIEGEVIPSSYRCEAQSPALSWTKGPSGTQSYALVFQDLENDYYHWLIYDIPETESSLPMGVEVAAMPAMPSGAKQGPAYNRMLGYTGPCARMAGVARSYAFTLYALRVPALLGLPANATAMQIANALD
ncbi:MAG TPA: YbhB/YbcL family Raf kinase inhibitor-like protein, partial [Burkholderiales bacterium]|nr:YbhB/YbcL family Raf kinase inhibitor-like protein [Burkholderiales bacterium]